MADAYNHSCFCGLSHEVLVYELLEELAVSLRASVYRLRVLYQSGPLVVNVQLWHVVLLPQKLQEWSFVGGQLGRQGNKGVAIWVPALHEDITQLVLDIDRFYFVLKLIGHCTCTLDGRQIFTTKQE